MYLSAEAIAALEGVRKTHFLNEAAIRTNKSLGDAVGLKNIGVHLIEVEPGHYSTEYHTHQYEEECLYILSGTGLATLGETRQPVGPGDFIGCPINGVPHDLFNDGKTPLTCLVMGQRLAQDVSDYPRQGKRLYRNSGRWDLVDLDAIDQIRR